MAKAGIRDLVFGLAAAGLLMGCVEGGGTAGSGAGASGAGAGVLSGPAKKKGAGQDVEAPEVFEATDSALWDGRPSLGGIWVAAPEVTNPERAIMFNPATGKSVTGALFKRERENPGPRLQLSSDAAEALGILAGQPTEIRVTALRKATAEEPTTKDPAPAAAETTALAADDAADDAVAGPAKDGDAAAIASAALAAVDAEAPKAKAAAPKAGDAASADPEAAAAAGAAAVAADGTAAAVDQAPKRKTWKERRAEARAAREAKKKAAAEAAAAASAAEAEASMAAGEATTATPEPATAKAAAVAPIESAPLDARKPEVAAGTEAAPKRRTVGRTSEPEAKPEVASEPAAEPAPAPAASSGPARSIQVASFSKEDNARRAAEALAKIGVTATPQKSEKDGKAVWGVIVQGDEAVLKKIKDAGFADAYFLK